MSNLLSKSNLLWALNEIVIVYFILNLSISGLSEAKIILPQADDSGFYKPYNIVFEGESLTAGDTYPNYVMNMLNFEVDRDVIHNAATSGQALYPTMIRDASHQVDPKSRGPDYRNIAVLWAGTNDIFLDPKIDVSALHESIRDWCNGRKVAGFQVIVCTITPRSDSGTPGTFEENRQAINEIIREHYFEYADGLADIAANPQIGDTGDELDTRYYNDRVHMTKLGYAIAASIVKDSIIKLTGP